VSRRRFEHTIVLAIAIELSMLIAFGVLIGQPRWKLHSFLPSADRQLSTYPISWRPDGRALLTSMGQGFEVVGSDGSRLLSLGSSLPVWVDDVTLMMLEPLDDSTSRLVRLGTDGGRNVIRESVPRGRLLADGRGRLAYQNDLGPTAITIIDPADGRSLAELQGYSAEYWTDDAALIVKRPEPGLDRWLLHAGGLFYWRPGDSPRALGSNLIDAGNVAPLSPAGDAIACICIVRPVPTNPPPDGPDRAIYRVPTDGAPATHLAAWPTHGGGSPEIAWADDVSMAVVGDEGLSRVSNTGGLRPIPGLTTADLGFQRTYGRVFELQGHLVAVLQDLVGGTESLLVVVDDQDHIRMRRWFAGSSMPDLTIDKAHERGAVGITENQVIYERPTGAISLLEFR
jgi:hypothetical protein